jgi:hypothetical protein
MSSDKCELQISIALSTGQGRSLVFYPSARGQETGIGSSRESENIESCQETVGEIQSTSDEGSMKALNSSPNLLRGKPGP